MYFKIGKHELFIERSQLHYGLDKVKTDGGWIALVGNLRVIYSHMVR